MPVETSVGGVGGLEGHTVAQTATADREEQDYSDLQQAALEKLDTRHTLVTGAPSSCGLCQRVKTAGPL